MPSEKSFSPVLSTVCLVGAVKSQDCDQGHNDEAGISIHNSPRSGSVRLKWKNFLCLHRPAILALGEHILIKFIAIHLYLNILNNVTLKNTEKKCINFRRSGTLKSDMHALYL